MNVTVNGQAVSIPDGVTVTGLLRHQDLGDRPCAVEVNRALVPKRDHDAHILSEGDAIEIVTLVGGG